MALAEQTALSADPDYLLWLNDDVTLDEDAIAKLLETERANRPGRCIVVGAVRDPSSGEVSYSGVQRRDFHPLRVDIVEPDSKPKTVQMFHGNVVLVSRAASRLVGPIDGRFLMRRLTSITGFALDESGSSAFWPRERSGHARTTAFRPPGSTGRCQQSAESISCSDVRGCRLEALHGTCVATAVHSGPFSGQHPTYARPSRS